MLRMAFSSTLNSPAREPRSRLNQVGSACGAPAAVCEQLDALHPTGVKYAKQDTLVWCFEAMQELHHGALEVHRCIFHRDDSSLQAWSIIARRRYCTELKTLLDAPHVARLPHRALDVCTPQQQITVICSGEIRPGSTSQQS